MRRLSFSKEEISKYLTEVRENYRPFDPGWYLYNKLLSENEKFKDEFIELVYVTLSAWNMNSRGAKLSEFSIFKKSILNNKDKLQNLSQLKIEKLSEVQFNSVLQDLELLFNNLTLVAEGKPRLVTFSKTMHFFLPDLVVPIDRKYTLSYFYKNVGIAKDRSLQFEKFKEIFHEFWRFASENSLEGYKDNVWAKNIPKIIDNVIIGYGKLSDIK